MEQYNVTGMSCAACSARVEKAVGKVPGVTACSVSLLTNSMQVTYDEDAASSEAIIAAVKNSGYGASLPQAAGTAAPAVRQDRSSRSQLCRTFWTSSFSSGRLMRFYLGKQQKAHNSANCYWPFRYFSPPFVHNLQCMS